MTELEFKKHFINEYSDINDNIVSFTYDFGNMEDVNRFETKLKEKSKDINIDYFINILEDQTQNEEIEWNILNIEIDISKIDNKEEIEEFIYLLKSI